ncbi:MAG: DNA polymerase III subunit alpha [Candidatus Eisenbacteria bacterium]|nr:DNA polymerase III subunit alpha [Candidatus Eisenbacteria bacterium]
MVRALRRPAGTENRMNHADFVHIHNHSEYSLLDGASRIDRMVERALEYRMPALAITDHGNLFGVIDFYATSKEKGLKPLVGMEAYVASRSYTERGEGERRQRLYHMLLLAKNQEGYRNLMRLSSIGYLEGFYYRPRIDKDLLRRHSAGLLGTTACLRGEPAQHILAGDMDAAREAIVSYLEIFDEGDFYLEVHNHGLRDEDVVRDAYVRLGRELSVPLVAANDCHYLTREAAPAHDVLLCIQTGKEIDEPNRMRMPNDEFYMKSPDEMRDLFADCPGAYENTIEIAEKCNLSLDFDRLHMPLFPLPEGFGDASDYLTSLAREGLERRYDPVTPEAEERLAKELSVIQDMGFSGYFLIVYDFINEARRRGIPVGPGRGSAAASIVSYCLGITELDPLHYRLVFERFLNPARRSMPDFDIDFCYERRDEIIDYVTDKYGRDSVAQVITFGTMQARGVIRDVGRVLKFPYAEVDRIAKMIPRELGITLEDSLERVPELRELRDSDERYEKLIEYSLVLEGLARHASVHAAGVIVAPGRIDEWAPLYKSPRGEITTQFAMKPLARIGLLKFDFLGLRTLTVIHDALEMIRENKGVDLEPDAIPLDDEETYELLGSGQTVGVFQLESSGMRDLVRKMKPERIEDIIAVNALFRPGPLRSGMVDDFVKRKHGRQKVTYVHPKLEEVLEETYGVIVYQEQVMQIASVLAGYSLGQADILLNAMRKKVVDVMAEQRGVFVEGAVENGAPEKTAETVFELMDKFAGYGFNKAHSASYAVLAVRTGYLKTHYPAEFMAATLTSEMDNSDRIVVLINECRRMKVRVLPPDVNEGHVEFRATARGDIQYGLGAIKNVGRAAIRSIIRARREHGPFEDIFDLTSRVDLRLVNRRVLESLVAAGALDGLHGHRAQQMRAVPAALDIGQRAQRERESGQTSLLDAFEGPLSEGGRPRKLPEAEPWSDGHALAREKDVLGLYVTGHPLARFERELRLFATACVSDLQEMEDGETIRMGGVVAQIRTTTDKKGDRMAFVTLEDFTGRAELLVFSSCYSRRREEIRRDATVIIEGRISTREEEEPKVIVTDVVPLSSVYSKYVDRVTLSLSTAGLEETMLDRIREVLEEHRGRIPVDFVMRTAEGDVVTVSAAGAPVEPSKTLIDRLGEVIGEANIDLGGSVGARATPEPRF